MPTVPVLTAGEAARWDAAAAASGRSLSTLMTSAGRASAQLILERWASAARQGVLVACGAGNNGGDGWVIARTLHVLGVPVWVTAVEAAAAGIAGDARDIALADGVRTVAADGPWPGIGLIVDALLGNGAVGPPRESLRPLLGRLVDLELPIVAIDGPTGLDLNTGLNRGELRAHTTITFGGVRRGHLLSRDDVGEIIVVDIGLGACPENTPQLIGSAWAAEKLRPFSARSHKGTRGHVVIVGGMPEMAGAARLCARAAFAAGAGLVHVVSTADAVSSLRLAEPDVQTHVHDLSASLAAGLTDLLKRADAIVIGPGLGRGGERTAFVLAVLRHAKCAVVDADALHALRDARSELTAIANEHTIICTPHPGEFRTLFPEFAADLETAPWEAAQHAAQASGCTVLLKGVPTVIAKDRNDCITVAAGNPGLATGGSGDVLTGILGALMASGMSPMDAAATAAQSLGVAADHAARRVTVRAMRPMDVITALPDVWRSWERQRGPAKARFPVLWEAPAPSVG